MRVTYLGVASFDLSLQPLEEAREEGEREIKHREPNCLTELDVPHIFPCLTLISIPGGIKMGSETWSGPVTFPRLHSLYVVEPTFKSSA